MLRTKDGDENSYKSSDAINNIDWSVLAEGNREYSTMLYYKGLIEMRKAYGIFTNVSTQITHVETGSGLLVVSFDDGQGGKAMAVINPHKTTLPYNLEGEWNLIADGTGAGAHAIARENGSVSVDALSVRIYVNDAILVSSDNTAN